MRRSPLIILSTAALLTGIAVAEEPSPVVEAFKAQISLKTASKGPASRPTGA